MSVSNIHNVSYGLSQPLINVFAPPIISNRNPTTNDKAPFGTIWDNKVLNEAFVLTSTVANVSTWISIGGGAGTFTNVVASGFITAGTTITAGTGITSTTGNIVATAGAVNAGTTMTAGTGLTVTAGNATITAGNVVITAGDLTASAGTASAESLVATGDAGATSAATTMTNVTNTTQSTGTLSIKATTANPGNNAGFLKFYVGATVVYVPYFTNISP